LDDLEKLAAMRLRMLRIGAGWSAETLAQKYEKSDAGEFNRTTIAKTEGLTRPIKAGEVAGVARIFGLTSTDLLDPDGPVIFLSYADKDGVTGQKAAAWLGDRGFRVISANEADPDDTNPGTDDRHAILTAQAFVALLSPGFHSSPRCRAELELAVGREQELVTAGRASDFIYLLRLAGPPDPDDPALRARSPIDLVLTTERKREVGLSMLGSRIMAAVRTPAAPVSPPARAWAKQGLLDRDEELEHVLYNLGSPAGSQFWLVTSPPGFGKSRFLEQLAARADETAAEAWVTRKVDLRDDVTGRPHDAWTVIGKLFDVDQPASAEPADDDLVSAAKRVIRTGRPWVCLVDSAELLPENAVTQLRKYLGRIHRIVQETRDTGARVAFVVGSRRDEGWKGVWPAPKLSVLPLGAFRAGTVQNAIEGLARSTRPESAYSPAELEEDAVLLERVTEGVPELVERCLDWIHAEEWIAIERLGGPQLFGKIIKPFIEERLLAPDSLFPEAELPRERLAKRQEALVSALRLLSPYRFFTLSHVYHYRDNDRSFHDALDDAEWSMERLWQAIAGTALLRRPLDEAWQETHPALRRLLFRNFYPQEQREAAHADARDFSRKWAAQVPGKEQVTGMVESIWHEAARLRLSSTGVMKDDLPQFVRDLSGDLHPHAETGIRPYTETELRHYAAQRMRSDDELQREVGDAELFEQIIRVVLPPEAQEG
jgi:hypothetical protein